MNQIGVFEGRQAPCPWCRASSIPSTDSQWGGKAVLGFEYMSDTGRCSVAWTGWLMILKVSATTDNLVRYHIASVVGTFER